ncbi:MAG: alpha/beta hydrolase [Candidatus Eiseniibacteriota bacterium]|nr:MAG: alpha/beta hydrolase [Candidatus Eisenbacteria bacterium]
MGICQETIHLLGGFPVAFIRRVAGGEDAGDTIVFVHGFGSAKEHFRYAFDSPSLEGFPLIATDLVGFGRSRGPEDFGYSMEEQGKVVLQILERLEIRRFHLCAHSMGGLVAMCMAEKVRDRVLSLVNMEGNLTPEDCTISGRVAGLTGEEFAEDGRRRLEETLRKAGADDTSMSEYAETFAAASTTALYMSSVHTVADSSTPLVGRLSRIKNVCFIYGEKNRGVYPGEALLRAAGIPLFYIPGAGHAMATENPGELYRVIRAFIDGLQ